MLVTDSVHVCQDRNVLEWYLGLCVVLTYLSELNMQILGCGAYTEDFLSYLIFNKLKEKKNLGVFVYFKKLCLSSLPVENISKVVFCREYFMELHVEKAGRYEVLLQGL